MPRAARRPYGTCDVYKEKGSFVPDDPFFAVFSGPAGDGGRPVPLGGTGAVFSPAEKVFQKSSLSGKVRPVLYGRQGRPQDMRPSDVFCLLFHGKKRMPRAGEEALQAAVLRMLFCLLPEEARPGDSHPDGTGLPCLGRCVFSGKEKLMNNFVYNTPTRVIFGRGVEEECGRLVREFGGSRVLLHYGGGSVERSGLLGRIRASLDKEGLYRVELGGVVPNPRLSLVREGVALGRQEGIDFVLAVGGGSVIDSAKAIGYGLADEGDVWDFYERKRKAKGCAPLGVVLTIAAAGSEMSPSCVITNEEGWIKRGYTSEYSRPRFAVMNPELTMTLPAYQTACGCVDILIHTMERYFHRTGGMEITDGIAEALLRTVMKNALILRDDPSSYDARAEIMWAGSLSHNGLTGCGTDGGDWASHKIEHELSGLFDVAHGAGLAAVWGSWARYVYREDAARFARFAQKVMGVSGAGTHEEMAEKGIEAMENFFRAIHMPTSLTELGVSPTEEEIRDMAVKCVRGVGGPVGVVRPLLEADIEKIYRMAR